MFWNLALDKNGCHFGVDPNRDKRRSHIDRAPSKHLWVLLDREGVQVRNEEEAVAFVLIFWPTPQSAQIVAQSGLASWLNSGKYPGHQAR